MGNRVIKKSQNEKLAQSQLKETVIESRKQQLEVLRTEGAIVTKEQLAYVETANRQLDRKGKALTKADLVAVVTVLQKGKYDPADMSRNMSVEDLNLLIRSIVYDTRNIQDKGSNELIHVVPSRDKGSNELTQTNVVQV